MKERGIKLVNGGGFHEMTSIESTTKESASIEVPSSKVPSSKP